MCVYSSYASLVVGDGPELVAWLVAQVLPREHREDHVREAMFDRCRALHIEPRYSLGLTD